MENKKKNPVASIILTLICILWMYPIVLILVNSLKKEAAITTSGVFSLPTAETWNGVANFVASVTQMDFPAEQAVEGHVPAVLRQQIGPQLAGAQQQDAHTAFQWAVHPGPFAVVHRAGIATEHLLFVGGQLRPEGERAGQTIAVFRGLLHGTHPFRRALAARRVP